MGYTTDFDGEFTLDRPLAPEHSAYLRVFCETRRMMRNSTIAETMSDPVRMAAGLPIGNQGEYFVGNSSNFGQDEDLSVIDGNTPPRSQPGLWCQWVPTEDGAAITWDGGEKFYYYTEWLSYIINNFIVPWGYTLNGQVIWQGEDRDDRGTIYVKDNRVQAIQDEVINSGPDWDDLDIPF